MSSLEFSINNSSWIHATRDLWLAQGIKLEPGARIADIESIELEIGFQFPWDMKDLYQVVDGFSDWDWTKDMFSIWPMQKILEEYKVGDKNFIIFCDFLINSHNIGFFKGSNGIFKSYDGSNLIPIADTFAQAIQLINDNSDLIY